MRQLPLFWWIADQQMWIHQRLRIQHLKVQAVEALNLKQQLHICFLNSHCAHHEVSHKISSYCQKCTVSQKKERILYFPLFLSLKPECEKTVLSFRICVATFNNVFHKLEKAPRIQVSTLWRLYNKLCESNILWMNWQAHNNMFGKLAKLSSKLFVWYSKASSWIRYSRIDEDAPWEF